MKPETKDPGQKFTPIWFGILGSLAVLLFILWLAVQPAPENAGTRAAEFWSLPLNSMGDALAGLAASLAFLWLIVTAFIQKNELKEQRAELELAREVQDKQLNAMKSQAAIFEEEQKQRREDRADKEIDGRLEEVFYFMNRIAGVARLNWRIMADNDKGDQEVSAKLLSGDHRTSYAQDEMWTRFHSVARNYAIIYEALTFSRLRACPSEGDRRLARELLEKLNAILELEPQASGAMQAYLRLICIQEGTRGIEKAVNNDSLWGESGAQ
ncbi:hypothetical protein [Pseudooceanicola sp. 200-1SW]|uniref:hypothetical protein n=1 Tax=Pseudooceanicola sp. 200-1SW TaxID=3425949 RepID=UPI003D7F5D44